MEKSNMEAFWRRIVFELRTLTSENDTNRIIELMEIALKSSAITVGDFEQLLIKRNFEDYHQQELLHYYRALSAKYLDKGRPHWNEEYIDKMKKGIG